MRRLSPSGVHVARILVIEDDEAVRLLLKDMLEIAGHNVLTAEDGEKGLELFFSDPADLVITDVWMPGKDGLEVIQQLREAHPATRIIVITSYELDVLSSAGALGVAYIFIKPFRMGIFLQAVADTLNS